MRWIKPRNEIMAAGVMPEIQCLSLLTLQQCQDKGFSIEVDCGRHHGPAFIDALIREGYGEWTVEDIAPRMTCRECKAPPWMLILTKPGMADSKLVGIIRTEKLG